MRTCWFANERARKSSQGGYYPTRQTVSSTVPSTHFTTATGFSVKRGLCGLPPQIFSISRCISWMG